MLTMKIIAYGVGNQWRFFSDVNIFCYSKCQKRVSFLTLTVGKVHTRPKVSSVTKIADTRGTMKCYKQKSLTLQSLLFSSELSKNKTL